jgi:hypothetical protein
MCSTRQNVRVIIQFIKSALRADHVLVAYSSARTFRPVTCPSLEELIGRFERAGIPEARRPKLVKQTPEASQILYAEELHLSDTQLTVLGLASPDDAI